MLIPFPAPHGNNVPAHSFCALQVCYERVCQELSEGYKQSHWMWFIFPQLKGLGHSAMANLDGISSLQEAEAYLRHPILGPRLRHCVGLVLPINGRPIEEIFGDPDDLKFRSCMTLFANTADDSAIFKDAMQKFFAGKPDRLTLDRLWPRQYGSVPNQGRGVSVAKFSRTTVG